MTAVLVVMGPKGGRQEVGGLLWRLIQGPYGKKSEYRHP